MSTLTIHWPFSQSGPAKFHETGSQPDEIPAHPISLDWAAYLCQDIQQANQHSWLSLARAACWRCHLLSRGDPAHSCFCKRADNRGCPLVNAREKHYYWAFHN